MNPIAVEAGEIYDSIPVEDQDMTRHEFVKRYVELTDPNKMLRAEYATCTEPCRDIITQWIGYFLVFEYSITSFCGRRDLHFNIIRA